MEGAIVEVGFLENRTEKARILSAQVDGLDTSLRGLPTAYF